MIDLDDKRLDVAKALGATALINSTDGGAVQRVMGLTAGQGVDVAIEAVGVPATFDICQAILAPGGRLANVGVHGVPVTLHLEKLGSQYHHHHTTGRYHYYAPPAESGGVGTAAAAQAGDTPLRAR
jgi:threonine dehydrogenase-like Zn-dependent dehydrogenase